MLPVKSFTVLCGVVVSSALTAVSCQPAAGQGLTMEQMARMAGAVEPHLAALQSHIPTRFNVRNIGNPYMVPGRTYDLDPAYPSHGMRYVAPPPGAFMPGAGGNQFESAGDSGDFGRMSEPTPGNLANSDRSVYDNEISAGLPHTTTAVQSLDGGFGRQFGRTQIPSGSFSYSFSKPRRVVYGGVSGSKAMKGRALPSVSTGSVDINIVDR